MDEANEDNQNESLSMTMEGVKFDSTSKLRKFGKLIGYISLVWIFFQVIFVFIGKQADVIIPVFATTRSALFWGALYLTIGFGLTLTYKVFKFANFAQAEFVTLGAYTALYLQSMNIFSRGNSFSILLLPTALVFSFIVGGLIAVLSDIIIFKPLRDRNSSIQTLMIASLGLALVIRSAIYLRFSGSDFHFNPIFSQSQITIPDPRLVMGFGNTSFLTVTSLSTYTISAIDILIISSLILVVIGIIIFIQYSKFGKSLRATSSNPSLAASSGVDVEKVYKLSWFISGGTSAFAGALVAMAIPIKPEVAADFLLPAFACIVLGSVGSLPGVLIASFIVGGFRSVSSPFLSSFADPLGRNTLTSYEEIVPFILLIFVLFFYTEGIGYSIENWLKDVQPKIANWVDNFKNKDHTRKEQNKFSLVTVDEYKAVSTPHRISFVSKAFSRNKFTNKIISNFRMLIHQYFRISDNIKKRVRWFKSKFGDLETPKNQNIFFVFSFTLLTLLLLIQPASGYNEYLNFIFIVFIFFCNIRDYGIIIEYSHRIYRFS